MRGTFLKLAVAAAMLFTSTGCAAVFRSPKVKVHMESDPTDAQATVGKAGAKATPFDIDVPRRSTTPVVVEKAGYAPHHGAVKKNLNTPWVVIDILTCPFTFCIPLVIDAASGAWRDVTPRYSAKLEAASNDGAPEAVPASSAAPSNAASAPSAAPSDAVASLSESERKATARAAYIEGVELQQKNDCAAALPKFEAAEKMFSAPTHLIRIAQCQSATGKLVDAYESYEKLTRMPLGKDAPEVFRKAQEDGRREMPALKPRIPSLRIQLTPAPESLQGLVVTVNGSPIPNELVGIARPVNPGKYRITAEAAGKKASPIELELAEGVTKSVDLKLAK